MNNAIYWRGHFLQRMLDESLALDDVFTVLKNSVVIESFSDDSLRHSCLALGFIGNEAYHIVLDINEANGEIHLLTIYTPDPRAWKNNFRLRA